jgi:flavodoxin/succinate dehydrogenase/fumarate reductase-like Fe-S protein
MTIIAKVWIEEDCIICDACSDICPEVFDVTEESSYILAAVRTDGAFDRNESKSALKPGFGSKFSEMIIEAAEACPVEIIKFEEVSSSADEAAEESLEEVVVVEEAAPVAVAPIPIADDGVLANLFAGDRNLIILFGSQTGNAEGLATKTAKLASDYGLSATVADMDGFNVESLSTHKRLLIITSTWGEGDMPDNAEDMWQAAQKSSANLSSTHFSICAIGDSSYDEFCKAGTDWDERITAMGGMRIHDIALCDVDFDMPWAAWVSAALARIACVDDAGVFQSELVEAMAAYAQGSDDDSQAAGDFTPAIVVQPEIFITLRIFRYDPASSQSGWDEVATSLPGHATIQDALIAIQGKVDGSLAFTRSSISGNNPLTGLKANGRIVLADLARISDLCQDGATLTIEPLPGHEVLKDLIVATDDWDAARIASKPWMVSDPRTGEYLENGSAIGVMDSALAAELHAIADVSSLHLIQGMSDCMGIDDSYNGPGLALQRWVRSCDPRSGDDHRSAMMDSLQNKGGIWQEADFAALSRQGADGEKAVDSLLDCRARLLAEYNFSGRCGRLVKNYARSVKASGNVNETTLYRTVLGPFGLASNIMNGVSLRMMLGFTRTGGPMMRGFQGMLVPPAGIGKIPDMFNARIHDHYEVVAIFNELDSRF